MYILCTSCVCLHWKAPHEINFNWFQICWFFFDFFHSIFMWRLKRTNEGKSKEKWKWFCENLFYIHSIYTQCVCACVYVCVYCIFSWHLKIENFLYFSYLMLASLLLLLLMLYLLFRHFRLVVNRRIALEIYFLMF